MPEISRFFGIVVAMYYDDHPPPHFHVRYGEYRAILEIETAAVLFGDIGLALERGPLMPIPPLE